MYLYQTNIKSMMSPRYNTKIFYKLHNTTVFTISSMHQKWVLKVITTGSLANVHFSALNHYLIIIEKSMLDVNIEIMCS